MGGQTATAAKGLAGVVVGQSRRSKVQGDIGKLQYVGYNIADLAEYAKFEEVAYLLWNLKLPTHAELENLHAELAAQYEVPAELIEIMKKLPRDTHPMAVLRTTVSMLALYDREAEDNSPEATRRKAGRITAQTPTLVAAWERIRHGKEPIAPNKDMYLSENFLYMLRGENPKDTEVKALDSYFVLLSDHGMNASTFAARVTTGTLADIYSALTTAVGTLKGPAHGGANEEAMAQFMEIGSPDKVDAWFDHLMETSGRIMGIGHRVYKALDPRASVLYAKAQALATGEAKMWFDIADKLDKRARQHPHFIERNLYANVDYYSAIVLYQIGIPVDTFTPLFAISRMAGWSAHIMEQWADNRLIRPDVEYVGPEDLPYVPIDQRG